VPGFFDRLNGALVTLLAASALALLAVNLWLASENRERQRSVSSRQQAINQSAALGQLNTQIVTLTAQLAVQRNDPALLALLANHGITVNINPAPAAAPAALPPPSQPNVQR
jgi:hypothetical protein